MRRCTFAFADKYKFFLRFSQIYYPDSIIHRVWTGPCSSLLQHRTIEDWGDGAMTMMRSRWRDDAIVQWRWCDPRWCDGDNAIGRWRCIRKLPTPWSHKESIITAHDINMYVMRTTYIMPWAVHIPPTLPKKMYMSYITIIMSFSLSKLIKNDIIIDR